MTLQQGGALQRFSIEAILSGNAGTSALSLSFPNLPQGLAIWPNQPIGLGVNQGTTAMYFIYATATATPGNFTVTISGTLGSVIHSFTFPVTINSVAPFHLTLSPPQLSLIPGSPASVQVTVVPSVGPVPDVGLNTYTLPDRWDFENPAFSGAEPGPFTLTFDPAVASQHLSNFPIFITATNSTGDASTAILPVNLTVPFPPITAPTRSTVVRTDDIPAGAVYDAARKLVFTPLPNLNEIRVFSSIDAHLVATIPAFHPTSIDEASDGSKVFAGSLGQIITLDPDSFQVTQSHQTPVQPQLPAIPPVQLVALSNGDVMFLSSTELFLWNPSNSSTTLLNPPGFNGTYSMTRSADHTKVLLSCIVTEPSTSLLYDASSGMFGSPGLGLTGSSVMPNAAAVNPDGSQIAMISPGFSDMGGFLYFYDGNFNLLSSAPIYNIDTPGQLIYSLDGTTIYAFFPQPDVGSVGIAYDTSTFAPRGLFSMANAGGTTAAMPYAIDETSMIFGPTTGNAIPYGALVFTDASHPGAMAPDQSIEPNGFPPTGLCGGGASMIGGAPFPPAPGLGFPDVVCFPSPFSLTQPFALSGVGFDQNTQYGLFVGPPPSSPASEPALDVSVSSIDQLSFKFPSNPPNNTPGPVNLTLTRPDGWYQVIPEAFSYGPSIMFADPTAIPTAGQITVNIFGYDFVSPTVTIGGQPATVISSRFYPNNVGGIFPLQQLQVTAPSGQSGPADITVTTAMGSTTLAAGVQYLSSAQVFPIAGSLGSLIYDQARQRLYISNNDHNRVEIFDLGMQALLPPISVGNSPTNLSLTADGSKLAVLNSTDGTISVIDPVQLKVVATYPGFTAQDQTTCGSTPGAYSATTMQPHRAVVALSCPFVTHVLNLDTGAISCSGIASCDAVGTTLIVGFPVAALSSSPDGTQIFISSGLSQVALLNLNINTLAPRPGIRSQGWSSAVNADSNFFANTLAIYNSQMVAVTLASGDGYFSTELEGELGGGEAFNPSGSLLFTPSSFVAGSGVDVFDVHRGRLALRIGLSDPPSVPRSPSIAVDGTGSKLFVLTRTGVTIAELAVVPLSIASVSPASGTTGGTITIRGSGFQRGATVAFSTSSISVGTGTTFVDGMTLVANVPTVPISGPVRLTVINPNGQQYFFDAAFTVN
jgi:DNA-binding beta-propeller fold protein YncE